MNTRYDVDRATLGVLLDGEPRYRVDQVWDGLYTQLADPGDITNLPIALRDRLDTELPASLDRTEESISDDGDTVKWLWTLRDGATVETVLMHYPDRSTVCISTQAGCAMACSFCATGQAGFERHLSVGEVVEQVVVATRVARPRRLSNVVFMGMGEPLLNFDNVVAAIRVLLDDLAYGLSRRRVTISTAGVVPMIDRLREECPVALAVSLHAPDDALRDQLVPLNRRYPIAELLDACRRYVAGDARRRVTFEYTLLAGINDHPAQARALAKLLARVPAKVNLIPYNPVAGLPYAVSPPATVALFRDEVLRHGLIATVRKTRGDGIDGACGQLAGRVLPRERRSTRVSPPA